MKMLKKTVNLRGGDDCGSWLDHLELLIIVKRSKGGCV